MSVTMIDDLAVEQNRPGLAALEDRVEAFTADVGPILATARHRAGGALDPVSCYRASGYRQRKAGERPAGGGSGSGIV